MAKSIDEYPFFLRHLARGQHLPHGWHEFVVDAYRTREEAMAALETLFPAYVVEGKVFQWETEAEFTERTKTRAEGIYGKKRKYNQIASRKRKPKAKK